MGHDCYELQSASEGLREASEDAGKLYKVVVIAVGGN